MSIFYRRRTRPLRIGLLGPFGIGDLGSEGVLEAMLPALRRANPEAELVCVCPNPDPIVRHYRINAHSMLLEDLTSRGNRPIDSLLFGLPSRLAAWVQVARAVRDLDAVIVPGNDKLVGNGAGMRGIQHAVLCWVILARFSGARVCLVSFAAPPVRLRSGRWQVLAAAYLATFRSYRDLGSKATLAMLGLDVGSDTVVPDVTFSLARSASRPSMSSPTIGVGVMAVGERAAVNGVVRRTNSRYLAQMVVLVLRLLDLRYRVRLLMSTDADQEAIGEVARLVLTVRPDLDRSRLHAALSSSLSDVMAEIADTDVVIAARYHTVVCAMAMGRPVISIGEAGLNCELMQDMGLGEFSHCVDAIDIEQLERQIDTLLARRSEFGRRIKAAAAYYAALVEDQYQHLFKHIAEGAYHRRF
jgi:polysaccharide pyruvyl transferase WcaK-like protein